MKTKIPICLVLVVLVRCVTAANMGIDSTVVPDDTIYGRVYDASTKQPLSQAFVYCQEVKCSKPTTDSKGYYAIGNCFSPSTTYTIQCARYGYDTSSKTVETDAKGNAEANFSLVCKESSDNTSKGKFLAKSWQKSFGRSGNDEANSVQQTTDGGYIIAGRTGSYSSGRADAWLIKTDSSGNKLWDKTFGGSGIDDAHSVQQTSDGGYIIAGENSDGADAWLIKIDSSGKKLWDKTFGGPSIDDAYSVQQTSDGGYIIAGSFYGSGAPDAWLIKTDSSGNKLWDKIWNKTFSGLAEGDELYSVQQTSDEGYIIAGYSGYSEQHKPDAWLIRTDSSGNKLWDKTFGGSDFDRASTVQHTTDGGYIIAGFTYSSGTGSLDAWLIKTDSSGNKLWDKIFGGSNPDFATSVQQTSDGGYIIAGTTSSYYSAGSYNISSKSKAWLIKTDSSGNKLWDRTFGGSGGDGANSVQQTSDGGYIIAGYTNGFAWLIKTDAKGN